MGVSKNRGTPNGWFIMENLLKRMIWGYPKIMVIPENSQEWNPLMVSGTHTSFPYIFKGFRILGVGLGNRLGPIHVLGGIPQNPTENLHRHIRKSSTNPKVQRYHDSVSKARGLNQKVSPRHVRIAHPRKTNKEKRRLIKTQEHTWTPGWFMTGDPYQWHIIIPRNNWGSTISIYWILVGEYTDPYFMAYNNPYITWYFIPYITQQGFDQSSCRMETESSMK